MASPIAASVTLQLHNCRSRQPPPCQSYASTTTAPRLPLLRRHLLLSATATTTALLPRPPSLASEIEDHSPSSTASSPTITDRIFMDFSLCPSYFRSDRPLGSDLGSCPDPEILGRVVFGLYGNLLPLTVSNFKTMCTSASYKGALVHKLLQGQYFAAGRQGSKKKGEVKVPMDLVRNTEVVDGRAFQLKHMRPGTLSLSLSENDDYEDVRMDPEYRNVEFLVTTGPGPCPQLDSENIVFGTVLEGLDVVTAISSIPTYKPAERIQLFNGLAEFLGDDRAQNARAMWNRPLKTIYISDCGEFKVAKPSLPPSLP